MDATACHIHKLISAINKDKRLRSPCFPSEYLLHEIPFVEYTIIVAHDQAGSSRASDSTTLMVDDVMLIHFSSERAPLAMRRHEKVRWKRVWYMVS